MSGTTVTVLAVAAAMTVATTQPVAAVDAEIADMVDPVAPQITDPFHELNEIVEAIDRRHVGRADVARVDEATAARKAEEQARREAEERARAEAAERARREAEQKAAREAAARKASRYALPTSDYVLTATFGNSGNRWASTHTGLDFAAPAGTRVRAVAAGRVLSVERHPAYGRLTKIAHSGTTVSWYAHQSRVKVSPGDRVAAGEGIGWVGSSGNSTGPHLHLEIRKSGNPVDPGEWLAERGINP